MVEPPHPHDAPDGDHYRRLVERVPAVIFELANDPGFSVRYVSPAIERVTGYGVDSWKDDRDLWRRMLFPADRARVIREWATAVEEGTPFDSEYRLIRRDGSMAWVRETTYPLTDPGGEITGWQGVVLEISEQRFAEEAAARSEARYRRLVEHLPAVVYVDSPDVEPLSLYVSPNAAEVLGHTPADYLDDAGLWMRTIHPDDADRVRASWAAAVRARSTFVEEYRFLRPDGGIVWVRDNSVPIVDGGGEIVCWQGVILDVTQTKDVEEELRRSERRYRALVEQVPAIVYEMFPDDERRTLYVSPHVESILGYSRTEWLEQPDIWMELLDADDRETELAAHDLHTESREPWDREYRLIASDGRRVWIRDQASFVEDPTTGEARWYGVMLDITARKEAEEALRLTNEDLELRVLTRTAELEDANEMMGLEIGERRRIEEELRRTQKLYRDLVEDLPAVVYSWEVNWGDRESLTPAPFPYISPQIGPILGYTSAEFQRAGFWRERLHPHDRDRVIRLAEHSAETGEAFAAEYRYLARDGRVVWVLDRATMRVRDRRGRPALFQGVLLDITARKEAEAMAEAAEERYRQLAERGPVASYILRAIPELEVEYVSPQLASLIGYPLDAMRRDPSRWLEIVHPDDRAWVDRSFEEALASGASWAHEYRIIRGDGEVVWLRDEARLAERDEAGRPALFQGVMLDVTAERLPAEAVARSEAQLRSLVEGLHGMPWSQESDPNTGKDRLIYIGPQCLDILGYTPEELIAEPGHFLRMVHPDDRGVVDLMSAESRETGVWRGAFRVITRDGTVRHLRGIARRTETDDGRHIWNGMTFEDVDLVLNLEDAAPAHARAGTDGASPEAPPNRPPAGGSRAGR